MGKRTALVTGASAGIGKELCTLFAKDGHDLVLVARSEARLRELSAELAAAHGITAHVVAADLGDAKAPRAVFDAVEGLGVTIDFLVNNAGFGSNGDFLDLDLDREAEMIEVNVSALVKLTHLFARGMRERRAGHVLNIASTAAFQPGPYMATYFATKAFVLSFSEALGHELEGAGVKVTCHCPGATATNFAGTAGNDKTKLFTSGAVAGAAEVAYDAYRAMHAGDLLAIHGAFNWVQMESLRIAPRALVRKIVADKNRS